MTVKARREELLAYIAEADDRKVDALYTLLEAEIEDTHSSYTLTEEQLAIVEERRNDYMTGKASGSSWEEAHARIRNNRKNG